jgi:hypothetical protein
MSDEEGRENNDIEGINGHDFPQYQGEITLSSGAIKGMNTDYDQ